MLQYLGSELIKLISIHFLKGLRKTMKKPVRIAVLWSKISIKEL